MGPAPTGTETMTNRNAHSNIIKTSTSKKALSKRQRRKQPNPATKWVQHPKIKSPAARSRAYLVDANLHTSSSSPSSTGTSGETSTLDPKLDLHSPEIKFGKLLGSAQARVRHDAVNKLRSYLKARCSIENLDGGISELDLMKLWKGLWYTLYMADQVPVQDELSKRLAQLIWCFAGTEEEDEYAAQVYLDMDDGIDMGDHGDDEEEDDDDDDSSNREEENEEDDDEDFVMEEIVNTLDNGRGKNEKEKDESSDDTASTGDQDDDDNDEILGRDEDNAVIENENEAEEVQERDDSSASSSSSIDDSLIRHCRGAHLAALFVRTFFRTVRREWGNMDKHRIDKFYTAIRFMIAQVYKYMSTRHWNLGIIRLFNDTLFEEVLAHKPNGLRYHLIDIALEELAKVNAEAPMPLTEATFLDCMEPYFAVVQTVYDKVVHERVMEKILTRFLLEFSIVGDHALPGKDENEVSTKLIMDQVHVGSVAQFIFELGSDPETSDRFRKSLYDMHKAYIKRIKTVGRDVEFDDSDGEAEEEDDAILGISSSLDDSDGEQTAEKVIGKTAIKESKADGDISTVEQGSKETNQQGEEIENVEEEKTGSKKKNKKKRKTKEIVGNEESIATGDKPEPVDFSPFHDATPALNEEEHAEEYQKAPSNSERIQEEQQVSQKKQRKRKKKKKEKRDPVDTGGDGKEEVITISTHEQRKAAKAAAVTNKMELDTPKKKDPEAKKGRARSPPSVDPHAMADSDGVMSDLETNKKSARVKTTRRGKDSSSKGEKPKRVSFGTVNRSKSYKASIKALMTMEQPSTASRTPDRSILLNSNSKRKKRSEGADSSDMGGSQKKAKKQVVSLQSNTRRKRAVDYF